jgi:xylan 1,4-beta-xylosidase
MATGEKGSQLDFISFHAKGQPEYLVDHVRMGISHQLKDIDGVFSIIASYPTFRDKPIVIGESDPERAAAAQGPELATAMEPCIQVTRWQVSRGSMKLLINMALIL